MGLRRALNNSIIRSGLFFSKATAVSYRTRASGAQQDGDAFDEGPEAKKAAGT